MVAADFSVGEADQLRRAMAAWKRKSGLAPFRDRLINGMLKNGYEEKFALQIFEQIKGFGEYGFPESHSASFALLVYVSAWLKCYEPAAFTCALLNSQPMGFYAPPQLVQDAQRHGVEVRAVDALVSSWDCSLEGTRDEERGARGNQPALRLGLRMVKGLSKEAAQRLIESRKIFKDLPPRPSPLMGEAQYPAKSGVPRPSLSFEELALSANLSRKDLNALAAAGALESLAGHRRNAGWLVAGIEKRLPVLASAPIVEATVALAAPSEAQEIIDDYASAGLTLRRHPLALLRQKFDKHSFSTAEQLRDMPTKTPVHVVGLVTCRQQPGTAKGVIFVTIEDETGQINIVVWESLSRKQRRPLLDARLLQVDGTLEREGDVIHVIAENLVDCSRLIGNLNASSRDFQ